MMPINDFLFELLSLFYFFRAQGIPARARTGYENYSKSDLHGDHWICEYRNESEGKWIQFDAQLDDVQIRAFSDPSYSMFLSTQGMVYFAIQKMYHM